MKKSQKKERILACCDICVHYEYDEDAGEVICTVSLDEDEYARYISGTYKTCPYYQPYDEYKSVRRQN